MPEPREYDISQHMASFGRRPLSTVLLERECLRHGLGTLRSGGLTFTATDPAGRSMVFSRTGSVLNSSPASSVARNKQSTRLLLEEAGVPAPRGRRFAGGQFDAARAFAEQIGYPVVCKPVDGTEGKGVVTGIRDAEELRWAFDASLEAARGAREALVEEHVEGEAHRIIVIAGEVVSALISRRGAVIGDGERTVAELLDERQALRERNPHLIGRPIPRGEPLDRLLARQGTALDAVPGPGARVEFSYGSNTHQGGEHAQVLLDMHPSLLEAARRAVALIPGLDSAGVDFIIEDITRPLQEQRAAICEINSVPAIDSHEYPVYGPALPVAAQLVARAAARAGLQLTQPAPEADSATLSVEMTVTGRLPHKEHPRWFAETARQMNLVGSYRRVDDRVVRAVVSGLAENVGVFLSRAYDGSEHSAVHTVESRPCVAPETDRFKVFDADPADSWAPRRSPGSLDLPGDVAHELLRGQEPDLWLVHTALLEAGLSTRSLPGGSLAAAARGSRPRADEASVSFSYVRSTGNSFGGAAMTRDRAALWPLLEARGVPTPLWRRFPVGAHRAMTEFADSLGWPVRMGAPGPGEDVVVEDAESLAVSARQAGARSRRSVVISSHRPGRRLDLLIAGREVLAAIEHGPDEARTPIPVAKISAGLRGLAVRALAELPGMALAQVHLAVTDVTAPLGDQQTLLVEGITSARQLNSFSASGLPGALELARELVRRELTRSGLPPEPNASSPEGAEQVRQLELLGVPDAEATTRRMEALAQRIGCRPSQVQADVARATLRAEISGTPAELALLATALLTARTGARADAALLS
ncbi:ATP-grasp domain-containing protein [Nesterenkonia xinjiangensis]|uniref:D-alanine-D-alanine ligase-like ATP-grasp enzyme/acylphosphatase n=1 Tax=Nesterenkonia xinjiangensis TaxID=225327 RepID=A0A7Z0GJ88_9MICC|nr:D-alanine-D-alanine ligase-like ATP-grasp enzyme/acylphosphatase [Nesterenkonia xinjiangensis]